jgi:hypothetical protein
MTVSLLLSKQCMLSRTYIFCGYRFLECHICTIDFELPLIFRTLCNRITEQRVVQYASLFRSDGGGSRHL